MNSPKMATQVKFHNWTLQERGRVELFLFSPIIFFFSRHFKKGFQQLGGRVFGGKVAIYALDPSYVSNPPKSVEWDKKIGTFQTCEKSSKTCLFSHNWSIVGVAH